jgi:hypothetical protein
MKDNREAYGNPIQSFILAMGIPVAVLIGILISTAF